MLGTLIIILPVLIFIFYGWKSLLYLVSPYIVLLLLASILNLINNKCLKNAMGLPPAIFATHTAYLLGMLKGLVRPVKISEKAGLGIKLENYFQNRPID